MCRREKSLIGFVFEPQRFGRCQYLDEPCAPACMGGAQTRKGRSLKFSLKLVLTSPKVTNFFFVLIHESQNCTETLQIGSSPNRKQQELNIRARFLSLCWQLRGFEGRRLSFDAIKLKFDGRRNEGMILWKGQRRSPVSWLVPDVPLNVDVKAPDKRLSLVFELWVLWRWERQVLCARCGRLCRTRLRLNVTSCFYWVRCLFLYQCGASPRSAPTFLCERFFFFTMPSPCFVSNIVKRIWIKILSSTNTRPPCQTPCFAPPSPDYKREEKQQATFHLRLE